MDVGAALLAGLAMDVRVSVRAVVKAGDLHALDLVAPAVDQQARADRRGGHREVDERVNGSRGRRAPRQQLAKGLVELFGREIGQRVGTRLGRLGAGRGTQRPQGEQRRGGLTTPGVSSPRPGPPMVSGSWTAAVPCTAGPRSPSSGP